MKGTDIKINLVTDEEEFKSKGYNVPCVELHNHYVDHWIPMDKLCFKSLEFDIKQMNRTTNNITHFVEDEMTKNAKCFVISDGNSMTRVRIESNEDIDLCIELLERMKVE